mmetsp:Transcript_4556/g.17228  ORF Transcript_4556/g.17228 Transcript_4556/m.17228 type:complete len:282 (-) Transcript_4556:100-945(-)
MTQPPLESTQFLPKNKTKKYAKNPLLVKAELGASKRSVYNLPQEQNFSFGKKNIPDKEGAGAVILNWKPSNSDEKSKNKQRYVNQKKRPNLPDQHLNAQSSFGIKTTYAETAKELITYQYEEDWVKTQKDNDAKRQRMAQQRKDKQRQLAEQSAIRKTQQATTGAARGKLISSPRKTPHGTFGEPPAAGLFKMKKFERVPPRLQTRGARDQMRTTNHVIKPPKTTNADRQSVYSAVSQQRSQHDDNYSEHPSYAGENLRDDISVHSSVSQKGSVHESEASY